MGEFIRTLEAARDAGVVTLIHCEDGALLAAAVRRLEAAGRTSLSNYSESRPLVAEVAATHQAAALCESTGAPMYVVHLSSARALSACRSARTSQAPLYVETRPLYLHLTSDRMRGADAPLYVGQPPLVPLLTRQSCGGGYGTDRSMCWRLIMRRGRARKRWIRRSRSHACAPV